MDDRTFPAKRQVRVEEDLASSLAIQLNALLPHGFSEQDSEQHRQVQECFQRLIGSTPGNDAVDELKAALPIAVQEWKKLQQTPHSKKPKSFSLLDQLGMGGGFATVNIQEMIELPSVPSRLEKLQKIEYLEDVMSHWNEVRTMLLEGLQYQDVYNPTTVAKEYLRLHRKWFHDGRSSTEYLGIQYHLCLNLSQCLQEGIQQQSALALDNPKESQWLLDLLINWHDMFLDLMLRDHYIKDEMPEIESTLSNILSFSPSSGKEQDIGILLPADMLALVDPSAWGFASWVHHLSPQEVVKFLEKNDNLVLISWERALATELGSAEEHKTKIVQNRRWQSLSILTYILRQTRVSLFPWRLAIGGQDNFFSDASRRYQLFDRLLLELGSLGDASGVKWKCDICFECMDIILSGSRDEEESRKLIERVVKPHVPSNMNKENAMYLERLVERVLATRA